MTPQHKRNRRLKTEQRSGKRDANGYWLLSRPPHDYRTQARRARKEYAAMGAKIHWVFYAPNTLREVRGCVMDCWVWDGARHRSPRSGKYAEALAWVAAQGAPIADA